VDSFNKEPDLRRTNMKETGREDGKLQSRELLVHVEESGENGVTT